MRHRIPLLLALVAVVALVACGGDDPGKPVVDTPPAIHAISPAPWTVLADSVAFAVQTSGADSVCLAVDDWIVDCDNSLPFELGWKTLFAPNGAHLLSVKAVNAAGLTDSSFAVVVYNPSHGMAVAVRPMNIVVATGDTARFDSIVLGTPDTRVIWSVEVPGGGTEGEDYGRITQDGLYTAPTELPFPATALIRATSLANRAISGLGAASLITRATVGG